MKSYGFLLSTPKIFKGVSGFRYLLKIHVLFFLNCILFVRRAVMIEVQTYHSYVRTCVCVYLYVLARTCIYVMSWNGSHLCELPIFQHIQFKKKYTYGMFFLEKPLLKDDFSTKFNPLEPWSKKNTLESTSKNRGK